MRSSITPLALAGLATAGGCAWGMNYDEPGPRFAESVERPRATAPCPPESIRIVSFNIKFARRVDGAAELLRSAEPLRDADIIALQEMDVPGTQRLAAALGMSYVYYPATLYGGKKDFGNAILSRWPIRDDRKILLPHLARLNKTRRAAVGATIDVGGVPVRVYSIHLATWVANGPNARREQARAVLADAAGYERVIVAGDMNSHGIGELFAVAGFAWPTREQPRTTALFNWDHIFLRGISPLAPDGNGVVQDNHDTSDHRPVWALAAPGAGCAED